MGLTPEDSSSLAESEGFVKDNGVPWPNAYGASETIEAFEVVAFPTEVVVGKDGKVAWHNSLTGNIAEAINKALAAR